MADVTWLHLQPLLQVTVNGCCIATSSKPGIYVSADVFLTNNTASFKDNTRFLQWLSLVWVYLHEITDFILLRTSLKGTRLSSSNNLIE